MELQEALAKRASLRKFTGEMPTDAEIGAVLDAAYLGPVLAFHDMRISVITNPELLKEAQENGEVFNRMDNPAYMYGRPYGFSSRRSGTRRTCPTRRTPPTC